MGKRKIQSRINMMENQLDPKIAQILSDLRDGKLSKKEIANKNRVDLAVVCRVMKSNNFALSQVKDQRDEDENNNPVSPSAEVFTDETNKEDERRGGDKMNERKQENKNMGGYKSGPKAKLSDEKIIKIISDIEELGGIIKSSNLQKIADNNGVSVSTVRRYGREFDLIPEPKNKKITKKKSTKVRKRRVVKKKSTEKGITVYHKVGYEAFYVGMFYGRHEMPAYVNTFIFGKPLSVNNIFNFEMMDDIVEKFIKDNFVLSIDDDGNYFTNKELILYLTGLSSALASVIKITAKYNINLTLAHYDNDTDRYIDQKIWDKPIRSNNPYVENIGNYTTTTWYKCDYEDIKSLSTFYVVQVVNFSSIDKTNRDAEVYIYMDEKVMWEHYRSLFTEVMSNRSKRLSIFVKTAHIEDEKIRFDTVLGRASNFDYDENK